METHRSTPPPPQAAAPAQGRSTNKIHNGRAAANSVLEPPAPGKGVWEKARFGGDTWCRAAIAMICWRIVDVVGCYWLLVIFNPAAGFQGGMVFVAFGFFALFVFSLALASQGQCAGWNHVLRGETKNCCIYSGGESRDPAKELQVDPW